jgi:hypothetical protein
MERESKIQGSGINVASVVGDYTAKDLGVLAVLLEPLLYLKHFLKHAGDDGGSVNYHSNELLIKINYQFLRNSLNRLSEAAKRSKDLEFWKKDGVNAPLFDRVDITNEEDFSNLVSYRIAQDPLLGECVKLEKLVRRVLRQSYSPEAQQALQDSIAASDKAVAMAATEAAFNLDASLLQSFDANDKVSNIWKAREAIELATRGRDNTKYPQTVIAMILAANQVIGNNIKKIADRPGILNELAIDNTRHFINCRNYLIRVPKGLKEFADLERMFFDAMHVVPHKMLKAVPLHQLPERKVEMPRAEKNIPVVVPVAHPYEAAHRDLFKDLKNRGIIKWKRSKKLQLLEGGKIFSDQDILLMLSRLLIQAEEQLFCNLLDNMNRYTATHVTNIINTPIEYWSQGEKVMLVGEVKSRIAGYALNDAPKFFDNSLLGVVVGPEAVCPILRYVYLLELAICNTNAEYKEVITKLLDFDAITNIEILDKGGPKPLLHAMFDNGRTDMLELLLSYNSDPNVLNGHGESLLYSMAKSLQSREDIASVIRYGADPRQMLTVNGMTSNMLYLLMKENISDDEVTRVVVDILTLTTDKYGFDAIESLLQSAVKLHHPSHGVIEGICVGSIMMYSGYPRQKFKKIFNIVSSLSKSAEGHEFFKIAFTDNKESMISFLRRKTLEERKALVLGQDLLCKIQMKPNPEIDLGKGFLHDKTKKMGELGLPVSKNNIVKHLLSRRNAEVVTIPCRTIPLNIVSFARFFCREETVTFLANERAEVKRLIDEVEEKAKQSINIPVVVDHKMTPAQAEDKATNLINAWIKEAAEAAHKRLSAHKHLFEELKHCGVIEPTISMIIKNGKVFSDSELVQILTILIGRGLIWQSDSKLFLEILDNLSRYTSINIKTLIDTQLAYKRVSIDHYAAKFTTESYYYFSTSIRHRVNPGVSMPDVLNVCLLGYALSRFEESVFLTKLLALGVNTNIVIFTDIGFLPLIDAVSSINENLAQLILSSRTGVVDDGGSDHALARTSVSPQRTLTPSVESTLKGVAIDEDVEVLFVDGKYEGPQTQLTRLGYQQLLNKFGFKYIKSESTLEDAFRSCCNADDKIQALASLGLLPQHYILEDPESIVLHKTCEAMGYGLVARKEIPQNTVVFEYIGQGYSLESKDDSIYSTYVEDNTVPEGGIYISAKHYGNLARFVCHLPVEQPFPECEVWLANLRLVGMHGGRAFLITLSTIKPGDELGFDYTKSASSTSEYFSKKGILPIYCDAKTGKFFREKKQVVALPEPAFELKDDEGNKESSSAAKVVSIKEIVDEEVDFILTEAAKRIVAASTADNDGASHASAFVTYPKLMAPPTPAPTPSPTLSPTTVQTISYSEASYALAMTYNGNDIGPLLSSADSKQLPDDASGIWRAYSLRAELYYTNKEFQILDIMIDVAKLRYEPTLNNLKSANLKCLYYVINNFPLMLGAAVAGDQAYQGEYWQAFKTLGITFSNILLPLVVWNNAPLGLALSILMTYYNVHNMITNLYDLEQLQHSKTIGAAMRSVTAFKDLTANLSETSFQLMYDFTGLANEYKRQTEHLNLLLDSVKANLASKEAANIMDTKHMSITPYEHCVQLPPVKNDEVDRAHYHCYNTDLELIDQVVVTGGIAQIV